MNRRSLLVTPNQGWQKRFLWAQKCGYREVIVSADLYSEVEWIKSHLDQAQIIWLANESDPNLSSLFDSGDCVLLQTSRPDFSTARLNPKLSRTEILWTPLPGDKLLSIANGIDPRWHPRISLSFSNPLRPGLNWKMDQIYQQLRSLTQYRWLQACRHACLLNPVRARLEHESKETARVSKPLISVVIPSYNSGAQLVATLQKLNLQNMDPTLFEVIIVDDGSSDGSAEFFASISSKLQFPWSYIRIPRIEQRRSGDNEFTAAFARNLGVHYARGEILSFLDADILVPPDYLQWIIQNLERDKVIMGQRMEAPESVHPYWREFYRQAQRWNELPRPWKYVCTHSLSLYRELFEKAGWFRENFQHYGYEDTDLGVRLHQLGAQFFIHASPVYHKAGRHEFDGSEIRKHLTLAKSAQIFYCNNLDEEAYQHCLFWFKPYFRIRLAATTTLMAFQKAF